MGLHNGPIFTQDLRVGNIAHVIATVAVNALANLLPINGRMTGELSDLYPNLFVPTGPTFSNWGLIYLLMLVFAAEQAVLRRRLKADAEIVG